jgi:hypothetical protein
MSRALTADQKAILDFLSRTTDPDKEALEQLMFMLETSPIARKAFGAELVRSRQFATLCRSRKRDLPKKIAEALEDLTPRSPSFEILVARAEQRGEEPPQLELIEPFE